MNALYKIIPFNVRHGNCGGSLVQFQQDDKEQNALPFSIGKVLVMSDIRTDDVRGNHANYETEEILVALTGGCVVDLDDGKGLSESVRLTSQSAIDNQQSALLLYPHVWRVMRDFEPGTTLMVIANIKYDEADYIRNRAEFELIFKDWNGLGGSSARSKG